MSSQNYWPLSLRPWNLLWITPNRNSKCQRKHILAAWIWISRTMQILLDSVRIQLRDFQSKVFSNGHSEKKQQRCRALEIGRTLHNELSYRMFLRFQSDNISFFVLEWTRIEYRSLSRHDLTIFLSSGRRARIWTHNLLVVSKPGLGTGVDPGMTLTQFPSSMKWARFQTHALT